MKWITRAGAKIDRVACPWLIRRFIDPQAEFIFVPADKVLETARREGAVPFDAQGVELGHHEGKCSFESIMDKYGLKEDALMRLARIVHGADIAQDLHLTPESAGLLAIADGLAQVCPDDHRKLETMFPIYDALYAYCQKNRSR